MLHIFCISLIISVVIVYCIAYERGHKNGYKLGCDQNKFDKNQINKKINDAGGIAIIER